jgi:hypothetical protein
MGHFDPIETAYVTHEEGNEGVKNGVERGILGFYGAKLLKKQGEGGASNSDFNTARPAPSASGKTMAGRACQIQPHAALQ